MRARAALRSPAVLALALAGLLAASWTPAPAAAATGAATVPAAASGTTGAALRQVTLTVRVHLRNAAASGARVQLQVPLLSSGLDAYQSVGQEWLPGAGAVEEEASGARSASYDVQVAGGSSLDLVQRYRLTLHAAGAWAGEPPSAADLAAEPGVEASDPRLLALAGRLTEGAGDEAARAARILRYVHDALRYDPASPAAGQGALAGWLAGSGTCTEFARLFVALARAAGVPARIVNGELLLDAAGRPAAGAFRSVVRHEWAEFWLPGSGWIPVDPTFSASAGRGFAVAAYVAENRGDRPVTGSAWGGRIQASVEITVTAGW